MARGRRCGAVRRARGDAARVPWPARDRRRDAAARASPGEPRGSRRHLRTHLEPRDQGQHPGTLAPGRRRLARHAGRLRAAAARLPGGRLADAELRRQGPGAAPLRAAARGGSGRPRRPDPRDAADRPGQPAVPRGAGLGPARHAREVRDRRWPRRGPRPRLAGRRCRLPTCPLRGTCPPRCWPAAR